MSQNHISATDYIKKLNPENKSGSIKEALDLIKNLMQVNGMMNPEMTQAVGATPLSGMLQGLMGRRKQKSPHDDKNQEQLEAEYQALLQTQIIDIQQSPQTQEANVPPPPSIPPPLPPPTGRTARYIRWSIKQGRNPVVGQNSVQASEFTLLTTNGTPITWPVGTIVTNPGGSNPTGEESSNLLDGNTATKWLDSFFTRNGNTSILIFDTMSANGVTFNGYRYTTANDMPERDPTGWFLETSNNGETWSIYDGRISQNITTIRQANTKNFIGSF